MKKFCMIVLSILGTHMLYSQTMTDSKAEYDENFNPIAKICLRNDSIRVREKSGLVIIKFNN